MVTVPEPVSSRLQAPSKFATGVLRPSTRDPVIFADAELRIAAVIAASGAWLAGSALMSPRLWDEHADERESEAEGDHDQHSDDEAGSNDVRSRPASS